MVLDRVYAQSDIFRWAAGGKNKSEVHGNRILQGDIDVYIGIGQIIFD